MIFVPAGDHDAARRVVENNVEMLQQAKMNPRACQDRIRRFWQPDRHIAALGSSLTRRANFSCRLLGKSFECAHPMDWDRTPASRLYRRRRATGTTRATNAWRPRLAAFDCRSLEKSH